MFGHGYYAKTVVVPATPLMSRMDERQVNELSALRSKIAGARIGLVHHGEGHPHDHGYRAGRMGQLAAWLTSSRADVTRFVPTYEAKGDIRRDESLTGTTTSEGRAHMVRTHLYTESVGKDRLRFLYDFVRGAAREIADEDPFDLLVVGFPPPGSCASIHRATSGSVPILADVRDLWPDAVVPSNRTWLSPLASISGQAIAQELRLASGVVAISETMLLRAPKIRRRQAITLCLSDTITSSTVTVSPDDPMRAVFVGSFGQGVDFDSLLGGWQEFIDKRSPDQTPTPTLTLCGSGFRADEVDRMIQGIPSISALGWVAIDDVIGELSRSDIGVVPTRD